jgi:hypothetical protein
MGDPITDIGFTRARANSKSRQGLMWEPLLLSRRWCSHGSSGCVAYRFVFDPMSAVGYRYELRRGDAVVATGHLCHERALEVGERLLIGGREGIVRTVEPLLGERELRLVVQLRRNPFP